MVDFYATLPPVDSRYHHRRSGDQTFSLPSYPTQEAWEDRASRLRQHILCVLGLWPLPERTLLRAEVFDRVTYDDFVMEKVRFESWPGFYCTGNLFRPRHSQEPMPAVLNPHGHAERGRVEHGETISIRARCITFARMGMAALAYDMVGYNDSLQVPMHRFHSWRGASWGFSPLALQLWNTLRAVDFLASLEGVDPERIGCTGGSGGGTQTFMAAAVEPRLKVLAPVNMVSAHFQGGCVCENAPGLRTETYNVEIAALAAPRPMLMVSATGDWTVNTPTVEYPDVHRIYALYGAEDRLAWAQEEAEHNYNAASRAHVYRWFARWFLGDAALGENVEQPFPVEPDERLRIYPVSQRPDPDETATVQTAFQQRAQERLEQLLPETASELAQHQATTRTRLQHILGVQAPVPGEILVDAGQSTRHDAWDEQPLSLGRAGAGDRASATMYTPDGKATRLVLLAHGAGQAGLQDLFGEPGELIKRLLDAGSTVLSLEPLYTGSVPKDALPPQTNDWFQATFNPPLLGGRVQDMLTGLAFLAQEHPDCPITLLGLAGAGPWALLAGALSETVERVYADLGGSEEGESLFVPAFAAYGGLPAASACLAPRRLLLGHASPHFDTQWAKRAYALTAPESLEITHARPDKEQLAGWVTGDGL